MIGTEQREFWGSRFGFVMAAAGSAVGLGNIWRFPYVVGENGGGAFLLIYVAIVALFGMSLAMSEIALGRATRRNPVGAFAQLGGNAWRPLGYLGVLSGFVILSFYIVVAGWTLAYIGFMSRGVIVSTEPAQLGAHFESFIASPLQPLAYAAVFMALVAWVVGGGIGKGIERFSKLLMPALFLLLIGLTLRAISLPGAAEGLRFFLTPDFSKVSAETFSAALAQAFFSLSLGMGCLLTYGSYLKKSSAIASTTGAVVGLDLCVSVLAGLMVMAIVFSFGFDPAAGPGLTFVTLPAIFATMPGGVLFGVGFFILLAVAALTSAISILEPTVAYLIDEHRFSRGKAVLLCTAVCFAMAIPSSLSFGHWSGFHLFGKTFFDLMDHAATNYMLPLGALLSSLFVGWKWSKGAINELSRPGAEPASWTRGWLLFLRFVAPPALAWILLTSAGIV